MKRLLIVLALFTYSFTNLNASIDEGMWLPLLIKQLNEKKMHEMGLKLSADDIYSINKSCIKDAVVRLGRGFCTGEIVSDKGLVFTNHHCGYNAIADLSSVETNFLTDGFWAYNIEDEIPLSGFTVSRLVSMTDVTLVINAELDKIEDDFSKMISLEVLKDSLVDNAISGNHYEAEVRSMFGQSEHYLMIYETFTDVRFVAAPPSSIGKFGGDTDNWMWPRHTGDFSILRIYTGKDGKPAEYSQDNVPYKPLHFFPISLKGYKENDFAMVFGYPGSTERYLTSYDIEFKLNTQQPALIKLMGEAIEKMKADMDADDKVRLELASQYAVYTNTHKYLLGQNLGLKKFDLISLYQEQEKEFTKWVESDVKLKEKYGTILSDIDDQYSKYKRITPGYYYLSRGINRLNLIRYISLFQDLYEEVSSGKSFSELEDEIKNLKNVSKIVFENNPSLIPREMQLMRKYLVWFYENTHEAKKLPVFEEILAKYKGNNADQKINAYLDEIFNNSFMFNREKLEKFLAKPSKGLLKKESSFDLLEALGDFSKNNYKMTTRSINAKLKNLHNQYIIALIDWKKDKDFYPDANSTLRLSYGKVLSYSPRNAVFYNYYSTHFGILEKEDPEDEEFIVPAKLKELLIKKDFGNYDKNDTLYICFLTDNDITGGNSGSPVIDGEGNLIGIAFDGNWEAMTGDIMVDPKYNRTISVDIRYVLFVIDKFAGAKRLIEELKIIN